MLGYEMFRSSISKHSKRFIIYGNLNNNDCTYHFIILYDLKQVYMQCSTM